MSIFCPKPIKSAIKSFLGKANQTTDYEQKWQFLEKAHIIGAKYPYQHTKVHFLMLLTAFNNTDYKEVLGQIPRLTSGWLVSISNTYPVGNSGRSNVGIRSTAPIAVDLLKIINSKQ